MREARRFRSSEDGVGASCRETIAQRVAELKQLDLVAVRRRWRALVGGSIPPDLGRPLTLRLLAYKLQAQHLGDLDKASLRELANFGKGWADPGSSADPLSSAVGKPTAALTAEVIPQIKSSASRFARPGTLLAREYGGVLHRVMVLEDGVSWNGKTYDSLSKVALAITGTKWNGPRFFGLRGSARASDDQASVSITKEVMRAVPVIGRGRAARQSTRVAP